MLGARRLVVLIGLLAKDRSLLEKVQGTLGDAGNLPAGRRSSLHLWLRSRMPWLSMRCTATGSERHRMIPLRSHRVDASACVCFCLPRIRAESWSGGSGASQSQSLQNILMQLRKCCKSESQHNPLPHPAHAARTKHVGFAAYRRTAYMHECAHTRGSLPPPPASSARPLPLGGLHY